MCTAFLLKHAACGHGNPLPRDPELPVTRIGKWCICTVRKCGTNPVCDAAASTVPALPGATKMTPGTASARNGHTVPGLTGEPRQKEKPLTAKPDPAHLLSTPALVKTGAEKAWPTIAICSDFGTK
ncbi:hypothetical protein KL86DPRO_11025 [uncultured delta proteobacterium]|uniref:Uncharacterized protein n=1 Tax=uncultured delta proteobacterium TaxID=34034 RepID=A0A212JA88_9DELT|nr:hypothetical protein KL86DPRO_11025 [uncultured delta proteobacterium]